MVYSPIDTRIRDDKPHSPTVLDRPRIGWGRLAPGDALPSVRETALQLAVNPMTVAKAYGLLELEGVLERRRGVGMVVADRPRSVGDAGARLALRRPALERAARKARGASSTPTPSLACSRKS
ncbi:GntR family transcriptional regulator [Massilia oculi]|uniref:GntR family transcriptional regulator n=1 Tax=Massilia oculi TaxID=945844 RepID=A0A2S2DGW9_9BURK|nr:GntR family transcriptional regulator [Massilia oculi]